MSQLLCEVDHYLPVGPWILSRAALPMFMTELNKLEAIVISFVKRFQFKSKEKVWNGENKFDMNTTNLNRNNKLILARLYT